MCQGCVGFFFIYFFKCNTTEKDLVPSGNIPGLIYCKCILVADGFVTICTSGKNKSVYFVTLKRHIQNQNFSTIKA